MSFKNSTAEKTTITRDTSEIEAATGNIYESIVMMSKRSNQLNVDLKEELTQKLAEFASTTDNLEEIFENREQIEISRFYERLPKPVAMSIQELMRDEIYGRYPAPVEPEDEK
ncbi:MAG: DNA-directed RNA polymerase subunit omega [Crocinitomicaceae bacterium]|nr:DNA-directed RNA polymerase subunit omega [Crocinitomicaceae bacterium]